MHSSAGVPYGGFQKGGEVRAEWVGDSHVRHQPLPEERPGAITSVVIYLVRDDDVAGSVILAQ